MSHISEDGVLDFTKCWTFLPKTLELVASGAPNMLQVGGSGSGKSANSLVYGIQEYCLRWSGCDVLCLRRTFPDLDKGLISDLKTYIPGELLEYNESKHIATFFNGSRAFFGHLQNNSERDLHQYLSASFPFILIDECAQFSGEAWEFLRVRNRVNPGCKPNESGQYPVPAQMGCTNPVGPHWDYYKTAFVDKQPYEKQEGARKDKNGRWWVQEAGEWLLVYDPNDYAYVHSTVLDNSFMTEKDPGIVERLNKLSPGLRDKYLFGYMDRTVGAYFSNFDLSYHVLNTRNDPEAITWQVWQPRWMGIDWGRAHWCGVYWFTKALVRRLDGGYKLKTVCYREHVTKGKNNVELADEIARLNQGEKISAIYFSHEKFAKQMEAHSPADEFSRLLVARGLVAVTPATRDRVGRATLVYNLLDTGDLVILDTCPEIIRAIPQLMRDDKNIEDVLKVDGKADDCFAAGTLIATPLGDRPIEEIRVGDEVWTRAGAKRVTRTFEREAEVVALSGDISLTCTGDHKIWTNSGWISAANIDGASVWKLSATPGRVGGDIQTAAKWSTRVTFSALTGAAESNSFTARFGLTSPAERFRRAITSTIETATSTTMTLAIWSRYLRQTTCAIMYASACKTLSNWIECASTQIECATLPSRGIALQGGSNGTALMGAWPSPRSLYLSMFARSAATYFRESAQRVTARLAATKHSDAVRVWTMWKRFVGDAGRLLYPINTISVEAVPSSVRVKSAGKQTVYDLTVSDVHEFFANGCLVRNCYDGFAYGVFGMLSNRPQPKEEQLREKLAAIQDPLQRHLAQFKATMDRNRRPEPWRPSQPAWISRVKQ